MTNVNKDALSAANGLPSRIERLEDLEALKTLRSLYAIDADRVFNSPGHESAVAMADLFTDDGVIDLGPFGRYEGRAALLNAFENILPGATGFSVHYMANPVLNVQGDRATGTWYFLIFAQAKDNPGGPVQNFWGYYEDQYVKRTGAWRFSSVIARYFVPPPAP
jgi:hypothetical protein